MNPICVARAVKVGEFMPSAEADAIRRQRLGETEVQHSHRAVVFHFDVGGLEIAVDDALLVRGFEGLGDLARDGQRLRERDRAAGKPMGQVLAVDQLHDEGMQPALLLEPVNVRDVRMVQRGKRAGLALESREAVRIGREELRQDLDGDVTFKLRVAGAIDLAHPAHADLGQDLVHTYASAAGERHRLRSLQQAG